MNILQLGEGIGVAFAGLGGFAFARRYGGGSALEQLERANRILVRRVDELEAQNREQGQELARLRLETNVAQSVAPILEALRRHEMRAAERSEKTLDVLGLIAARLGPEPAAGK